MMYTLAIIVLLSAPNIHELIEAKKWDEAEAKLVTVSPGTRPRLEGLIAQGRGQSAKAAEAFERALVATPGVPQIHLHAAHAYFQLGQFNEVLRHARAAQSIKNEAVAQPLLEARALEALKRDGDAYVVLNHACNAYQEDFRPCLELAALAHRKELTLEVRRAVRRTLSLGPDRDACRAAFHLLKKDPPALPLLEQIVALYPKDAEFRGLLAHVYANHQKWFSAARLFEEAVRLGGNYAFEAADQYRMAGQYGHALRMNGKAAATQAQRIQRLSILFEQKRYARIVAMKTPFKDLGSRYRIAYAHYAVGDDNGALRHAQALLDTSYREEATALIKALRRDDDP